MMHVFELEIPCFGLAHQYKSLKQFQAKQSDARGQN